MQNEETEALAIEEEVKERSLLRKLDARLLPGVGILYLLSFLDRSNGMARENPVLTQLKWNLVGNARIEGMVNDLHMSSMTQILCCRDISDF